MSKGKSTGIGLSPNMVAKLEKTADRVGALAVLFEKRNHDAGRICIFLQEELPDESYLKHIKSIKRALKRSYG